MAYSGTALAYNMKLYREKNNVAGKYWIWLAQDDWLRGFCEHGNEDSGSIKDRELFD
jgi:hypothetical protein